MILDVGDPVIPGYHIVSLLGTGSSSHVYCAVQESLRREVALKVTALATDSDRKFLERMAREVRILTSLSHPGLLQVLDAGEYRGRFYAAMPLVRGGSFKDLVDPDHMLRIDDVVRMACVLADALAYLHDRGVLHRDIKPANVLLDGAGRAFLGDFGLALDVSLPRLTADGEFLGTPLYSAPETISRAVTDRRSDQFQLGVTLYHLAAGCHPFGAEMIRRQIAGGVPGPGVDPAKPARSYEAEDRPRLTELLEIVGRACRWNPEERYGDVRELVDLLRSMNIAASRFVVGSGSTQEDHESPTPGPVRIRDTIPPRSRRRNQAAVVILGSFLAGMVPALMLRREAPPPPLPTRDFSTAPGSARPGPAPPDQLGPPARQLAVLVDRLPREMVYENSRVMGATFAELRTLTNLREMQPLLLKSLMLSRRCVLECEQAGNGLDVWFPLEPLVANALEHCHRAGVLVKPGICRSAALDLRTALGREPRTPFQRAVQTFLRSLLEYQLSPGSLTRGRRRAALEESLEVLGGLPVPWKENLGVYHLRAVHHSELIAILDTIEPFRGALGSGDEPALAWCGKLQRLAPGFVEAVERGGHQATDRYRVADTANQLAANGLYLLSRTQNPEESRWLLGPLDAMWPHVKPQYMAGARERTHLSGWLALAASRARSLGLLLKNLPATIPPLGPVYPESPSPSGKQ